MKSYSQKAVAVLFTAVLTVALFWFGWGKSLENLIYDNAVEYFPAQTADDTVIVAIDEKTLLELGEWPFSRAYHGQLVQRLKSAGVAALGFDVIFSEYSPDPDADAVFAQALNEFPAVVLPFYIQNFEHSGQYLKVLPVAELAQAAAALGHVQIVADSDGKSRSVFLQRSLNGAQHVHFAVALEQLTNSESTAAAKLEKSKPHSLADGFGQYFKQLIPFVGSANSFPSVSYSDVIKGRIAPEQLRGKTVIVGATAQGMDPVITALGVMSGAELNANIVNGLRGDQMISLLPPATVLAINVLVAMCWAFFFAMSSVRRTILATVCVFSGLNLLSFFSVGMGLWLPLGAGSLAIAFCLPVLNWWRLSGEMSILAKELGRLKKQNMFLTTRDPELDILSSIQFLESLYPLAGWSIRNADFQKTRSGGKCDFDRKPSDYSDNWVMQKGHCFRKLDGPEGSLYLTLAWDTPGDAPIADTPITKDVLARLFPVEQWATLWGTPRKLLVEESMLALEDASRRAESSNALLLKIIDNMQYAVLLMEANGEILKISQQAENLFGQLASGADLASCLPNIVLKNQHNWRSVLSALVLRGEAFSIEGTASDGRELQCVGTTIDIGRPLMLLTFADITLLKQEERKRFEAINFLSHDLRSPMASVLALIEEEKINSSETSGVLNAIAMYMERSISYADNYIQLSKIEANKHLKFTHCLVDSILDSATSQLFDLAKSRNVRFAIDYRDEGSWVNCDRIMLERAFLNLIDNAIKYGREGGDIVISLANSRGSVVVEIIDDGPGASEADLDLLFEAFQQGDNGRSSRFSGAGLGLKLAASVVARHGGEIKAANTADRGLCMTVTLPLATTS